MAIIPWSTGYPATLDTILTNFPTVTNNVDEVLASHVNELAKSVVALQNIVGTTKPLPVSATTTDLSAPIITGTITGGVTVTDISGSVQGFVEDFVEVEATDPQGGAFVLIPMNTVNPLPDRFRVYIKAYTLIVLTDPIYVGVTFRDSSGTLEWTYSSVLQNTVAVRPSAFLSEPSLAGPASTWPFPDLNYGQVTSCVLDVEKVAPFTTPPQLKFVSTAYSFESDSTSVTGEALAINPSTGPVSAGWTGEDFHDISLTLIYTNNMVGAIPVYLSVEIDTHPKDR